MEHQVLKPGEAGYPRRLSERLGPEAPVLWYYGPLKLLDRFTVAVAASDSIPAQAMLATNQLLFTIREYGLNYIGGWHSVMETEIFRIALDCRNDSRNIKSLTMFSARGLEHESWEGFLADRFGEKGPFTGFPEKEEYLRKARAGELLVLSLTEPSLRKMTRINIMARNLGACALADVAFIPFAEKGTKTYTLCKRVLEKGIPIFASECAENGDLVELGIPTVNRNSVARFLDQLGALVNGESPFPASRNVDVLSVNYPATGGTETTSSKQADLFAKDQD